jgi:hypothetical protein
VIVDRLARRAGRTVRLHLIAAAGAGDDQEVLVNPADLGAGQAGQEGRDGQAQLLRRVEGERGVVASLGLGPEPPGGARARMPEGLCRGHREPAGPPDGVPERGLAVQALLVLGETEEVATPDRPRVLLRGAGVEEQLAAGPQHPGDGGQEAAQVEVVHAVQRGDQVQAGGPQRQLFGCCEQRHHPPGRGRGRPALSWASMAAETSLATSSDPSGNSAHSSRVNRPVPQPTSRPLTGRSGRNWPIAHRRLVGGAQ